jgi:hypothetical protein
MLLPSIQSNTDDSLFNVMVWGQWQQANLSSRLTDIPGQKVLTAEIVGATAAILDHDGDAGERDDAQPHAFVGGPDLQYHGR